MIFEFTNDNNIFLFTTLSILQYVHTYCTIHIISICHNNFIHNSICQFHIIERTYNQQHTMAEYDAFPTADTERQPPMIRLLRKICLRRSSSESKSLKRLMSTTGSVITAELDVYSIDNFPFGCLKVRTHDDSISRNYYSDGQERRSVAFSTIEVRTYPIILGDNPSVSSGPPFTIDWDHQDSEEIDLSDYEILKPEKRTREQILLPARVRESWLRAQGYARSEIVEVGKEVNRIKKCRNAVRPREQQGFRLW